VRADVNTIFVWMGHGLNLTRDYAEYAISAVMDNLYKPSLRMHRRLYLSDVRSDDVAAASYTMTSSGDEGPTLRRSCPS
jgi:hypothetical protein